MDILKIITATLIITFFSIDSYGQNLQDIINPGDSDDPELCDIFGDNITGGGSQGDLCNRSLTGQTDFSLNSRSNFTWEEAVDAVDYIRHSLLFDVSEESNALNSNQTIKTIVVSSGIVSTQSASTLSDTIYSINLTALTTPTCILNTPCRVNYGLTIQWGDTPDPEAESITIDNHSDYLLTIHWQQQPETSSPFFRQHGFVDMTVTNLDTLDTQRIRSYDKDGSTALAKTYYHGVIDSNFDNSNLSGILTILHTPTN